MKDIVCVGELNVDLILSGVRRAPAFGLEILAEDYTECLGSSTAICACVAASLGLDTTFFGTLGEDRFGSIVIDALRHNGVDTGHILVSPAWRTGITVSISGPVDRAMVTVFGDTIDGYTADMVPLERLHARHMHAGSYFLQPKLRKGLPELFERARAMNMTTSLDAGWDEYERFGDGLDKMLPLTDFFFPNEKEAAAIAGTNDLDEAAVRIAAMGCTAVVKNGAEGAILCVKGSARPVRFAAYKTTVVDTTGAGDSFNAGFLYAYLKGMGLDDCMRYGNACGAVSVTRPGGASQCPTLAEVEATIGKPA